MRLLLFSILFVSLPLMAQESLFPEFSDILDTEIQQNNDDPISETEIKEETDTPIQTDDQEITEEVDLFEKKEEIQEVLETETETEKETETEDDKRQKILIGVTNVDSTLTPNRNMSFCSITFGIENKTRKELANISGTFTIGTYPNKFKFLKVAKGTKNSEEFFIVGESCEQVLATPTIEITTCQVPDWSDKKCRSKIEIVPITKEQF